MKIEITISEQAKAALETFIASHGTFKPHPVSGVMRWQPEYTTLEQYMQAVADEQSEQALKMYPPAV